MPVSKQIEKALFEAAQELTDPAVRVAFLDQSCHGQPALRDRLEKLLAVQPSADEFFRAVPLRDLGGEVVPQPAAARNPVEPADSKPVETVHAVIGRYRLQERLGEGGCGVVYLAEQQEPVRRKVALKIIRLGMDTENVIARFAAERQALALMDHPNIAHVLDAGATESGRPYFVMEWVQGVKITDYCNQNHLGVNQRLHLFIQICHAIQHAHQKGVIHRDIKPSNILVMLHDGVPLPKVIDFGIAKATEGRLTDNTTFTACDQLVGTPAYMSPEQADLSGVDVDTRSDIYSLGVLLYELLTGQTPFDSKELVKHGMDELRRTLQDQEPPAPSTMLTNIGDTRLTAVAAQHSAEPSRLLSTLRGDLDWIVMKALEKDRARRYETANGLAMDVERYLNHEPVVARPPSRLYRFQKLVRRNWVVFAAIAAVTFALLIGLGVSTWLFIEERKAHRRAVEAEQQQVRLREEADRARNDEASLRREAEAQAKITQAAILLSRNKFAEAEGLVNKIDLPITKPSVEASGVFRGLADWNVTQGRWKAAAEHLLKLVQANQIDKTDMTDGATRELLKVGPVLVLIGDTAGYQHFIGSTVARFSGTQNPVAAEHLIKVGTILPMNQSLILSLEPLAKVAEKSFADDAPSQYGKRSFYFAWRAFALALFEYRRGNFPGAVSWGERSLAYSDNRPTCIALSHTVLAMACYKLNQPDRARAELAGARGMIGPKFPNELGNGLPISSDESGIWHDWVELHILLREATALMAESK